MYIQIISQSNNDDLLELTNEFNSNEHVHIMFKGPTFNGHKEIGKFNLIELREAIETMIRLSEK